LRVDHQFRGYIHLKSIPEASQDLIAEAGKWADRLSINVELPTQNELRALAPEKNLAHIEKSMTKITAWINQSKAERGRSPKAPVFAPAGQSTQMIVGATPTNDATILQRASSLYQKQHLRRVYYSAFSPIPDASSKLPITAPPLVREHRLYQADWLMRFYGFNVAELTTREEPNLPLSVDPKLAWALRNQDKFPVDLNKAARETLLRVPGLGVRNVDRIIRIRRWHSIRLDDLTRLRVPLTKAMPFIAVADHSPRLIEGESLIKRFVERQEQRELFQIAA
jgi:putative DNA modification/repair radical SAM protein